MLAGMSTRGGSVLQRQQPLRKETLELRRESERREASVTAIGSESHLYREP